MHDKMRKKSVSKFLKNLCLSVAEKPVFCMYLHSFADKMV